MNQSELDSEYAAAYNNLMNAYRYKKYCNIDTL